MTNREIEALVDTHDERISDSGIAVWIGMEPTFTRRFSEAPEWLSEALGAEKRGYAYDLLRELNRRAPGGVVLHTLGRQYAGENLPRWSLGYYQARQGQFVWEGPPDPRLVQGTKDTAIGSVVEDDAPEKFRWELNRALNREGWQSAAFEVEQGLRFRLLVRCDGELPRLDPDNRPQLRRRSVHAQKIPLNGLTDELALNGDFLISLDLQSADNTDSCGRSLVLELPAFSDVAAFVRLLQCTAEAARNVGLESLVIQGFPPPVDARVAWTTITPDPAVIEVNQAPSDSAAHFYANCDRIYAAAKTVGLHPYRLHYNGVVADSGGGGQFTLGGPEPLGSPFFLYPELLPRLVRYFNAHPALSYWFAPPSIGGSSQSPRTDEGVRESFRELSLALDQLQKTRQPTPEFIWRSLSPFLVDPSGNPHRSEMNIEKLWNPYLPGRGCLGLVEFRAFRMSRSPECAAAIAVLLRSVAAMLIREDKAPQLLNHGLELHDKYALPFYLQRDLQRVFADLQAAGFAIDDRLQGILLREPIRVIGRVTFQGCTLELQQALEFWPLVGDVASQETGGSRLVDASTTRLQVSLTVESHHLAQLDGCEVWLDGYRIPFRVEQDRHGPVKVMGLRYRNFMPLIGLHPGIAPRDSIRLLLVARDRSQALEVIYHEWHPQGSAYPGLPENIEEAAQRRAERMTSRVVPNPPGRQPKGIPSVALTDHCLDLRRLPD